MLVGTIKSEFHESQPYFKRKTDYKLANATLGPIFTCGYKLPMLRYSILYAYI